MSHSKVHSQGTVPFSWENKPGISKATQQECPTEVMGCVVNLPPPPCLSDNPKILGHHDLQIPLPPCPFQPPSRSSSRKGLRRQEDPFLAAYKECTKSDKNSKLPNNGKRRGGSTARKGALFSCKQSCDVRDDSLVRLSSNFPSNVPRERLRDAN